MSQNQNGKSVSEKLEAKIKELELYDKKNGISQKYPTGLENEVDKIISMPISDLKKMTKEEIDDAAFCLSQMSFFLQKQINDEMSILKWADSSITYIISPIIASLKNFYSNDDRRIAAIRENDAAKELYAIVVDKQIKIERMSYLTNRIETIIKTLISRRSHG